MIGQFYRNPFPILDINEKYYLREQQDKDSTDFFQYYTDPAVGQHILATKPQNLKEATQEIQHCRNLFHHYKGIYWSLADKSNDKMIGAIGIYVNHLHQRGEICYDLAQAYWNQGIMTAALNIIVEFSFATIGLTRLEATTLPENIASHVILKKLGFEHEGTLKKYRAFNNKFYDIEMFAKISPIMQLSETYA